MVFNDPALPASCLRYCPRVAPQLPSRPTGVPMWALRRHDGESAGRPCVSDGVDLAAIGDCDAGTGGALRCGPLSRHTPKHPPAGRASLAGSARAVRA
jgi:hypothetical protein